MDANKKSLHWAEASAVLYLVIPLFIFFAAFIRYEFSVPACALIGFLVYELVRRTAWREFPVVRTETFYFLFLALFWSWLAGGMGPTAPAQNSDWMKHNLIIDFLADNSWPASQDFENFGNLALRYYVGWHLVPALILKVTGADASALVGSLWSTAGIFIFFNLVPGLVGRRPAIFAAPLIFILFGGTDFIASLVTRQDIGIGYHYEWWAGWAQFSSNTTAYFWCPNQALAAWLGIAMLMRCRHREVLLPYCALLVSAALLWSPLATIGLIPFLIALTVQHGTRHIAFDWRVIASTLLLALPVGLYLISGSGALPHGYTGAYPCSESPCFTWPAYFIFLAVEVGAPLLILIVRGEREQGFLVAAVCALCLIPLYTLGVRNDFVMRASLPSLAVLAILCGKLFSASRLYQVAAVAVVLLGFPTVFGELSRGFVRRPELPPVDLAAADQEIKWWIDQTFAPQPIWVLR